MRILQVSAHYPPDFVSGGSLVPRRFAHELARRGHESLVFAGRLKGVEPGEVLDEEFEGVRVRWVGNSSFLGWADEKNVNNPKLSALFEEYLREVNPDVVHFHSIQTLGAQMLDIAKSHGYPTVVTMHDFWWVCARQFLVDREGEPCSPVVSCGNCRCEAGRGALLRRKGWLADRLRSADLILFPSESARRVLIANGVPESRTAVNENGIDVTDALPRREGGGPVRFMYTGGDAQMKGYEVLREAANLASVPEGTTLDLYNTPAEGFPQWAHTRPRYDRDEIGEVFAAHDVLILPSLMRESHSIVTREALRAGLAVIATDSVGPEEAMMHGTNGLVVKSGDARELARAIEALADPATARLMLSAGSGSPIVSVDEQIDDVERHYAAVTKGDLGGEVEDAEDSAAARAGVASTLRKVLFVIGIQGAPGRYRAHLPAEALGLRGVKSTILHYNDPAVEDAALASDAVIFYRVPATDRILEIIERLRASERIIPILGDVDDLIFDPSIASSLDNLGRLSEAERELWIRGLHRYRTTLEMCDYFVGSTELVSAEGERLLGVPAQRFDNGVGILLAQASERFLREPRSEGPVRLGFFSGTNTHDADWASIERAVARVLDCRDVEIWLGGLVEPTEVLRPYSDRIRRLDFVAWNELPGLLRDVDVCLAPLTPDSRFNEAKSAIKWLEAALVETPTIASGTQPFREAIRHGETGMIAEGEDEWVDAMLTLIDSAATRAQMGREAKRQVLLERSADRQSWAYLNILVDAWFQVARNGHKPMSSWPQVADPEPVGPVAIEPYSAAPTSEAAERLRMTALKVMHSLRTQGLGATARKAVNKVRGV